VGGGHGGGVGDGDRGGFVVAVDEAGRGVLGPDRAEGGAGAHGEAAGGFLEADLEQRNVARFDDQGRDEVHVLDGCAAPAAGGRALAVECGDAEGGVEVGGAGQHARAVDDVVVEPRQGRRRQCQGPAGFLVEGGVAEHGGCAGGAVALLG